jgi:hypothetical protein
MLTVICYVLYLPISYSLSGDELMFRLLLFVSNTVVLECERPTLLGTKPATGYGTYTQFLYTDHLFNMNVRQ